MRASNPSELAQQVIPTQQTTRRNVSKDEIEEKAETCPSVLFIHPFSEPKEGANGQMDVVQNEDLVYEGIDLSCLSPWRSFDSKFIQNTLLLVRKSDPNCSNELVRHCFYLLQHDTLCYSSLLYVGNVLNQFITTHSSPFLVDLLLLVVIPRFAALSEACETHFEPLCTLRSSFLSLLFRLRADRSVSLRSSWLSLFGFGALMTSELWTELNKSAEFSELLNVCQQREKDEEDEHISKLCFLATCCRFVEVSEEELDASEACLEVKVGGKSCV